MKYVYTVDIDFGKDAWEVSGTESIQVEIEDVAGEIPLRQLWNKLDERYKNTEVVGMVIRNLEII